MYLSIIHATAKINIKILCHKLNANKYQHDIPINLIEGTASVDALVPLIGIVQVEGDKAEVIGGLVAVSLLQDFAIQEPFNLQVGILFGFHIGLHMQSLRAQMMV